MMEFWMNVVVWIGGGALGGILFAFVVALIDVKRKLK